MATRNPYLRAGHWLTTLRELASQGLTDRAVAERLNQQYPDHHFTRLRVHRWRIREVEHGPGGTLDDWPVSPQRAREVRQNQYQWQSGWTHLLPEHVLTPRQCDVLSVLRDNGPLSRRDIARVLGIHHHALLRNGLLLIHTLVDAGLVTHLPCTWPRRYTVAGRAAQPQPKRPYRELSRLAQLFDHEG